MLFARLAGGVAGVAGGLAFDAAQGFLGDAFGGFLLFAFGGQQLLFGVARQLGGFLGGLAFGFLALGGLALGLARRA